MTMRTWFLVSAMTVTALAAERFDHAVRNDFFLGFAGNAKALERGMATAEKVLAAEPDHAEAMVWHGAGTYYQAGQAFRAGDMQKGMMLYQKGLAEMAKAVELAPKQVGVRIPRGATLLMSTRNMQGNPQAKELLAAGLSDYETVYELQKNQLSTMPEHPKGELLSGLADAYVRTGRTQEAQALYQRIAKEMVGTVYAENAAQWLEKKQISSGRTMCLGCHVK